LFFGLSFLSPEEVNDCFTNELMSLKLKINGKLEEFFDYILENYSLFPPSMWAEYTSSIERTTNCCESFHSKFNSCFYSANPNIFQFMNDVH
jgi:hypothetical protein